MPLVESSKGGGCTQGAFRREQTNRGREYMRQQETRIEGGGLQRRESCVWILTILDALPDVDAFALWIPYSALAIKWPVDVGFPYSCCVTDDGAGHD